MFCTMGTYLGCPKNVWKSLRDAEMPILSTLTAKHRYIQFNILFSLLLVRPIINRTKQSITDEKEIW